MVGYESNKLGVQKVPQMDLSLGLKIWIQTQILVSQTTRECFLELG